MISGTEEARLIHLAAVYGVDVMHGPAVVIDIGGGSVEITLGDAETLRLGRSFKMGVIRLTERFVTSDPLAGRDERKMVQFINHEIEQHAGQIVEAGFDRVIGTSGTILSLGTMAAHAELGRAPGEIRNLRIPARQIHRLRKQVVSLGLQQRLKLPGLEPRRSDIVVAGAVLLDTILRRLGATDITLCDLALREGLVLDYISRNRAADRAGRPLPGRAAAQRRSSWRSGATTSPTTPSRSRGWPCRCSTRRAPCTASAIASVNGWSTPPSCTISGCTSATRSTTAIRITWSRTATCGASTRRRSK